MAQICNISVDKDVILVDVFDNKDYLVSVFDKRIAEERTALESIGYVVDTMRDVLERDLDREEKRILVQAISNRIHQFSQRIVGMNKGLHICGQVQQTFDIIAHASIILSDSSVYSCIHDKQEGVTPILKYFFV